MKNSFLSLIIVLLFSFAGYTPDLIRVASDYSDGMYHGSLEPGLNG